MCGGRDTRGLMHGKADVVIVLIDGHLADVDPHPNAHVRVGGPRGSCQRHLSIDRTEDRRRGIGEGHEQSVSFALQDRAAVSGECIAEHTPVLGKERPVLGAQRSQEIRRTLDVGEEQSKRFDPLCHRCSYAVRTKRRTTSIRPSSSGAVGGSS